MNIVTVSPTDPTNLFRFNGLDYQRGEYLLIYSNKLLDDEGSLIESKLRITIKNKTNLDITLCNNQPINSFSDGTSTFINLGDLLNHLSSLISFNQGGGLGDGIVITQQVNQFNDLTDGEEIGDLAYVENPQGTKWLPYNMLGTYYPSGWYVWDGTSWGSDRNAIASELESILINNAVLSTDVSDNKSAINYLLGTTSENTILVKSKDDITQQVLDPTKLYIIDGIIDIQGESIWIPEEGLNLVGLNPAISQIVNSLDNCTAFIVDPNGTYSGALRWNNLSFTIGGANSKVFDLDNQQQTDNVNNNIDFTVMDFVACTSLGEISNYRQFFISVYSFIVNSDGLTFSGTWSGGARFSQGRLLQFSGTIFKAGTNLTFGSRFSVDANITIGGSPTNSICDFTPINIINDLDFQFTGAKLEGKTQHSEYFPTMPLESTKVLFKFNTGEGFSNTYIGGFQEVTNELLTPLVFGTEVDLLANTTPSNLVHFVGTTTGALNYIGTQELECKFNCDLIIDGGANDNILVTIRIWRESSSSYETIKTILRTINNQVGGSDNAIFTASVPFKIYSMDRFDSLRVQNISDGTNVTLEAGSTWEIVER